MLRKILRSYRDKFRVVHVRLTLHFFHQLANFLFLVVHVTTVLKTNISNTRLRLSKLHQAAFHSFSNVPTFPIVSRNFFSRSIIFFNCYDDIFFIEFVKFPCKDASILASHGFSYDRYNKYNFSNFFFTFYHQRNFLTDLYINLILFINISSIF